MLLPLQLIDEQSIQLRKRGQRTQVRVPRKLYIYIYIYMLIIFMMFYLFIGFIRYSVNLRISHAVHKPIRTL